MYMDRPLKIKMEDAQKVVQNADALLLRKMQ
jgi:hypothetical protein